MKRKSTSSDEDLKPLRVKVNSDISKALEILDKDYTRTKTDIIRTSLYDYLTKNYPGLIPKTDYEIKMKAKEQVAMVEYQRKYVNSLHSGQWIPVYEKERKELFSKVDTIRRKKNTINGKLTQTGKDPKGRQKLNEDKEELLDEYDDALRELDRNLFDLEKLKMKKSEYVES